MLLSIAGARPDQKVWKDEDEQYHKTGTSPPHTCVMANVLTRRASFHHVRCMESLTEVRPLMASVSKTSSKYGDLPACWQDARVPGQACSSCRIPSALSGKPGYRGVRGDNDLSSDLRAFMHTSIYIHLSASAIFTARQGPVFAHVTRHAGWGRIRSSLICTVIATRGSAIHDRLGQPVEVRDGARKERRSLLRQPALERASRLRMKIRARKHMFLSLGKGIRDRNPFFQARFLTFTGCSVRALADPSMGSPCYRSTSQGGP